MFGKVVAQDVERIGSAHACCAFGGIAVFGAQALAVATEPAGEGGWNAVFEGLFEFGREGFAVHIADFGQVSEKQGEVGFLILQGGEEVGNKAFVVSFVCLLQTEFAAHFL